MRRSDRYEEENLVHLHQAVETLEVSGAGKEALRRWAHELKYAVKRREQLRNRYYMVQLTIISVSFCVTCLSAINATLKSSSSGQIALLINIALIIVSATTTLLLSANHLFQFDKRYLLYRERARRLNEELWTFINLSGNYLTSTNHSDAYQQFKERIWRVMAETEEKIAQHQSGRIGGARQT